MSSSTEASESRQPVSPETSPEAWNDNLLQNPHTVADKRARVQKMFAAIAPSYDLNNRLHSLWMDQAWRRKAVKLANLKAADVVVDVACGTGDLTFAFAEQIVQLTGGLKRYQTIGIDFTFEMLPLARDKAKYRSVVSADQREKDHEDLERRSGDHVIDIDYDEMDSVVPFLNGDAQSLPLPDQSADVVSIAFGIRNVQDPAAAVREFHRVLRPGGRLIVLEFSLPTNPVLRGLYNLYFRQVLPRTATLISGDKTGAYKYLPESVNTFISRETMMSMMRDAGFTQVKQFPMTFGVCICYRGLKT
jgi:demethylmenaquinone methyltransferase/2-methoxy-6-polyprenyl-1,4-benzoquinol methylase